MPNKAATEIAYDILASKKRPILFSKLWEEVSKTGKIPSDRIGQFYNDLSLDSRFVSLKENKWDLKERRKFNETHVDISKIEVEDEPDEDSEVEEEENDSPLSNEDEY